MRVVLTGGVATGKSYVLARFATLGAATLDADQLAHEAYAPGGPAWQALRDHFGADMFDDHGRLHRRRLGALIFADDTARAALNAIVHPHVRAAVNRWFMQLESRPSPPPGIVAIPLFYEGPRSDRFDVVIVTACDPVRQLNRVMARGLDETEARRRIDAQLPTADKVKHADLVIRTDGTHQDTDRQVGEIYRRWRRAGDPSSESPAANATSEWRGEDPHDP